MPRGQADVVVSASAFKEHFEDAGCSYVAIEGYGDYADDDRDSKWPERALIPPGPEQLAWTIDQSFVRVIPDQFGGKALATRITFFAFPFQARKCQSEY